jgi:hypothetical protein
VVDHHGRGFILGEQGRGRIIHEPSLAADAEAVMLTLHASDAQA